MVPKTKTAKADKTNETAAEVAAASEMAAAPAAGAPDAAAAAEHISDADVNRRIDAGIADAVAGRRPLPTPGAEAAAAIAEAPIDPRPGSGSLDERPFETAFEGLTTAEIAALNAHIALFSPDHLLSFRSWLVNAPINPVKGQGSLDGSRPGTVSELGLRLAGEDHLLPGIPLESRALRPMPVRNRIEPFATHIRVRSTREGHRRAGRAWSTAAVDVAIEDFTNAQLEQLQGDPTLIVESI